MAAEKKAATMSGSFDFAKWGMDDGFTDSDEEFLCPCGKVHPPTYHQEWRTSAMNEQLQAPGPEPPVGSPDPLLSTM